MRARPLLLLPLVLAAGACGAKTVDTEKGEEFIAAQVERQVGARVASVSCPEDVEAETGGTFDCKVTGSDGTTGTAKVIQKDDEGNVRLTAPFVHVRNLEKLMATNLGRQVDADVTITCPEIITGKRGDTFDCDASDGKEKAVVKVTQKDAKGNVDYELVQQ